MQLAFLGGFDDYLMPELGYLLIGVSINLVVSALIVFTCNLITKNWMQPFIWGVVIVVVFYFKSIILMNAKFLPGENLIQISSLNIIETLGYFIWDFAFMFGFVFAVNVWGVRIGSLITALILSYIVYKAMSIALGYGPFLTEINFVYLFSGIDVINLVGRIFTALFFFGALFIHFDNLQSKKALQKTIVE